MADSGLENSPERYRYIFRKRLFYTSESWIPGVAEKDRGGLSGRFSRWSMGSPLQGAIPGFRVFCD
jgi:hypothetical protein